MRAAVAQSPGPLDEVVVQDVPAPGPPGAGEVLVRMTATTVNPSDAVTVSGAYPSRTTFPFVPGFEGIGKVEQVGGGVDGTAFAPGQRVLPLGGSGCWQQLHTVDADWCVPVPDDLPDDVACFSYINPLTAAMMVRRYCTGARTVVVTAASSSIAAHLAELLTELTPVRPVGLVRGAPVVADPSRWRGVVSTAQDDWRAQLRAAVGSDGADVVLDCIGGSPGLDLMEVLAPEGTLVLYGLLSGEPLHAECFSRSDGRTVDMFRLRDTIHSVLPRDESLADLFRPVFDLQRRGLLCTEVSRRVGLSELPEVLAGGEEHSHGKLLIDPQT